MKRKQLEALEHLTGQRAVRLLPPLESTPPYDWEQDPELTTRPDSDPNPLGFTVRSSELGSNWTASYHLARLRGELPAETLPHPDEVDWQEEQDARLLDSAGDTSWDDAFDASREENAEDWDDWAPPPEE